MTAAASMVVVLNTNLFNCMFCIGVCGVGSGSGSHSGYGVFFLDHHLKHLPNHTHSIHFTAISRPGGFEVYILASNMSKSQKSHKLLHVKFSSLHIIN